MHLLDSVKAFSGRLVAERQRSLEVPMKIVALGVSVCVCLCVSMWTREHVGRHHDRHRASQTPLLAQTLPCRGI